MPDDLLVSKIRCQIETEITLERQPVDDWVLDLLARKGIQLAQRQHLKPRAIDRVGRHRGSARIVANSTPLKKTGRRRRRPSSHTLLVRISRQTDN